MPEDFEVHLDIELQMLAAADDLAEKSAQALSGGEGQPCAIDQEAVFYLEYSHGLRPGHIYSEAGVAEFRNSGCCEYHFDKAFEEPEGA